MLNLNPLSETKLHTSNPNQLLEMHTDYCLFTLGTLILWHALKMLYLSLTNTTNWNLGTILFTIQVLHIWVLHQNFHLTLLLNNWILQQGTATLQFEAKYKIILFVTSSFQSKRYIKVEFPHYMLLAPQYAVYKPVEYFNWFILFTQQGLLLKEKKPQTFPHLYSINKMLAAVFTYSFQNFSLLKYFSF